MPRADRRRPGPIQQDADLVDRSGRVDHGPVSRSRQDDDARQPRGNRHRRREHARENQRRDDDDDRGDPKYVSGFGNIVNMKDQQSDNRQTGQREAGRSVESGGFVASVPMRLDRQEGRCERDLQHEADERRVIEIDGLRACEEDEAPETAAGRGGQGQP